MTTSRAPDKATTQKLLDERTRLYSEAFESLSVDSLSSWHSKDVIMHDIALDKYNLTRSQFHSFMTQNFASAKSLRILEQSTTGTPEFTAWEMLMELVWGVDEPKMDIRKGEAVRVRGTSLIWWKWEGDAEEQGCWDGDVSEAALRKWKIVREHDYMCTLKDGWQGAEKKIFAPS